MSEKPARINEDITVPKVRAIDFDGKQIGILSTQEAIALAMKRSLDLVEVAPQAEPPVCRIMDYGKFRYEQTKKEKEAKKKQHSFKVKEIKLRPNIDIHDYETKLRQAQSFLEKGYKLKTTVVFHGRELAHSDIGAQMLERFIDDLKDYGSLEMQAKNVGRTIVIVIGPTKSK